jgi:uncharacterized phage protein (TIGR02220 family)
MRQDGAYRRMIDLYYSDEKPLPVDRVDLYGSLRCRDKADNDAVEHCLRKFFTENPDGFHHNRCDEEVAKYREKSAKASAAAAVRWDDLQYVGNADAMRTHSERNAMAMPANNHKPVTKNQKTLNPLSTSASPKVDTESLPAKAKINGNTAVAADLLLFLNKKTGRSFRPTASTLKPIIARLKEGYTPSDCKAVIMRRWRRWQDDPKMAEYLRPATLFGAEKFAQYVGEVPTDAEMEQENAD